MKRMRILSQRGSILIFTIWVLSLLVIFASYIGLRIRQRASVLARVEQRAQLRSLAQSGVKKTISFMRMDLLNNGFNYTLQRKQSFHNNATRFGTVILGNGSFEIITNFDSKKNVAENFGVVDEQGKINLNFAEWMVIKKIIKAVLLCSEEEAVAYADAIIDWCQLGEVATTGFYSQDYYQQLSDPYETKDGLFERLDELLLVKGFSEEVYDQLILFVTIYGNGRVNINSAPKVVFLALGLDEALVDKILQVRRGNDNKDFTADDHIFGMTFDLASDINAQIKLKEDEIKQIDDLNAMDLLSTSSDVYQIKSRAVVANLNQPLTASCIYNILENRIEYYKEK